MWTPRESELLDIIATEIVVRKENFERDSTLDQLGLDSIGFVSIVYAIDEKYGIALDTDKLAEAHTLGEFLAIVVPLTEHSGAAPHA
jgi:acyl carrier protein